MARARGQKESAPKIMSTKYVICTYDNPDDPVGLTQHKVYRVIPSERDEWLDRATVIDDNGQALAFSMDFFVELEVPEKVQPFFNWNAAQQIQVDAFLERDAKPDLPMEREDVAYHEAAHAVAYMSTRLKFKKVTILPNEEGSNLGSIRHRTITDRNVRNLSGQSLLDYAFICFAGPAQDELRHGSFNDYGCYGDLEQALNFVERVSYENMQVLYDEAWERAKKFVRDSRRQAQIEVIAQALLNHDTLTFAQTADLLKGWRQKTK